MNRDYPTDFLPATPEYVFAVFCDQHRRSWGDNEPITMDTTVEEWDGLWELESWRLVGRALNKEWDIAYTKEEWCAVLEPARTKTLRDVCKLIAAHARRPVVRRSRLLGANCDAGGVFLTLRSQIGAAGADTRNVRPSTLLDEYARKHFEAFGQVCERIAPGALPPAKIQCPSFLWFAGYGFLISVALSLLCVNLLNHFPQLLPLLGAAFISLPLFIILFVIAGDQKPKSVTFGDLRTWGDMARWIASSEKVTFA